MMQDISKEWIKASLDDLKIISRIIDMEELSHMIAFHSQQPKVCKILNIDENEMKYE